jgi:hypothetical protein
MAPTKLELHAVDEFMTAVYRTTRWLDDVTNLSYREVSPPFLFRGKRVDQEELARLCRDESMVNGASREKRKPSKANTKPVLPWH